MMKRIMNAIKRTGAVSLALILAANMAGCGKKSLLDPKNPVSLTIWH